MAHVQKSVAQPVLEKDWNAVSATKPYTVKQTELKENSAAAIDINAAAAKVNQAIIDSEKNQPSKEKTETPVIVPVE